MWSRWLPAWNAIATAMLRFVRSKTHARRSEYSGSSAIVIVNVKSVEATVLGGARVREAPQPPERAERKRALHEAIAPHHSRVRETAPTELFANGEHHERRHLFGRGRRAEPPSRLSSDGDVERRRYRVDGHRGEEREEDPPWVRPPPPEDVGEALLSSRDRERRD
jgi:hypothetical protein